MHKITPPTCTGLPEREHAKVLGPVSETHFPVVVESAGIGIALVDMQGRPLQSNPALQKMLGYSAAQLRSMAFTEFTHPDDRERDWELYQELVAGKRDRYELEKRFIRNDGEIVFGLLTVSLIRDGEGSPQYAIGMLQDITARKQAEVSLRESEARFRTLIENAPSAVSISRNGATIYVNQKLLELFGYQNPGELVGCPIGEFWVPEYRASMQDRSRNRSMGLLEPTTYEGVAQRRDGSRFPMFVATSIVNLVDGPATLAFLTDLTQRKRANGALRRMNRELRAITKCNEVLVRAEDENGLLQEICRIICDNADYYMAWVGYAERDDGLSVRPVAMAGSHGDFLDTARVSWADTERGRGPSGTAIRTGKTCYNQDVASDPACAPWREEALRCGFRATISLPLKDEKDVPFGALTISSSKPGVFTPEEIRLLEGLAGDLAFGITTLRARAERKQAEAELLKEKALSDAVINSLPGVFYMFDGQGRLQRWNDEFARVVGITPETAHTHLLGDLIVEEDREKVRVAVQQAYAGGQASVEARSMTTEGLRWFHFVARSLQIGEHTYLVGSGYDVTDRKQMEEAHVRLSTAVAQSAETIVITDTEGRIVYVNPAFESTTGYSAAEAIGNNPRFLKSGRQEADFYENMWQTLKRGEVWRGHFINRRKDGSLFEEDATISPVRDTSGKIVNYTAIKLDVTRQIELEAQFLQSQKLDAIGQLAGGVAHDFNNILTAMMMEVELVSSDEHLPAQFKDLLQNLRRFAERAADLTRQLVMFSRKQVMQRRYLDLNETVTSVARMLQRIIGEQIQLQLQLHPRVLAVHADAGMMDQVLLNLVVNARDAMPGGGKIVIETTEIMLSEAQAVAVAGGPAGRYARLSVVDTGCGIAPANLPRIFEPFFTTKEPGKGTGLGLATVFGIVKQHDGAITVKSDIGQGSTFQVFLRAAEVELLPVQTPERKRPSGGTETILLVEDESTVRQLACVVLERAGYRVFEAANGVEALRVWERQRDAIQLLLTDIVMPEGITGRELAARLQTANPALRVVFTSGYSAEIAGSDLTLNRAQRFIQKPWLTDQLLETVRHCLDG